MNLPTIGFSEDILNHFPLKPLHCDLFFPFNFQNLELDHKLTTFNSTSHEQIVQCVTLWTCVRLYFCPYSFLTGRHETNGQESTRISLAADVRGSVQFMTSYCYPVTTATLTVAVKDAESFQHHFEGMSRTLLAIATLET